jgi:hypothetical protein
VKGLCRKLHNEELNNLHCSTNFVLVIKSKRIKWARNLERMRKSKICTGFWLGILRDTDHLAEPGVDGRIILR